MEDVIDQQTWFYRVFGTLFMSFGFDTIVLKENNLRIFFDDTSTSASFPRNDWRIIANDSYVILECFHENLEHFPVLLPDACR